MGTLAGLLLKDDLENTPRNRHHTPDEIVIQKWSNGKWACAVVRLWPTLMIDAYPQVRSMGGMITECHFLFVSSITPVHEIDFFINFLIGAKTRTSLIL